MIGRPHSVEEAAHPHKFAPKLGFGDSGEESQGLVREHTFSWAPCAYIGRSLAHIARQDDDGNTVGGISVLCTHRSPSVSFMCSCAPNCARSARCMQIARAAASSGSVRFETAVPRCVRAPRASSIVFSCWRTRCVPTDKLSPTIVVYLCSLRGEYHPLINLYQLSGNELFRRFQI